MQHDTCLILDIEREKDSLRMCAFPKDEAPTLRHYSSLTIDFAQAARLEREIVGLINTVGASGALDEGRAYELKKACRLLFDLLLAKPIKEKLRNRTARNLIICVDESIAHIPWEILHTGEDFLCLGYNLGRGLRVRDAHEPAYRIPQHPASMLVLADPQDNLAAAGAEALRIRNLLDARQNRINVDVKITNITSDFVKKNIRDYDIVHYAGHAEYCPEKPQESGWLLADAKLRAAEILKIGESATMPALVFANACESSMHQGVREASENDVHNLARAFLLSSVRHYIGCICRIPDDIARVFAGSFYGHISRDKPVGEALRLARLDIIKEHGEHQIGWMGYVLFGDPLVRLFSELPPCRKTTAWFFTKRVIRRVGFCIGIALVAGIGWSAFTANTFSRIDTLFARGENNRVIALCLDVLSHDPDNLKALVRLAEVAERSGQPHKALEHYFKYAAASDRRGDHRERAAGYIKIAWVYYLQGDYPKAFTFYSQAIEVARANKDILHEAVALRKLALWHMDKENYEEALQLLLKSSELNRSRERFYEYKYNLACDYFDLGLIFTDKEDADAAKRFYAKSLELFKALGARSEMSDYYSNMAELFQMNKEYSKAKEYYELSLAIDTKTKNLPSIAATYTMMGELYLEMRDYKTAREYFLRSMEIHKNITDPVNRAWVYEDAGLLEQEQGNRAKAREYLDLAQRIYKNIETPDYARVTEEIAQLGE